MLKRLRAILARVVDPVADALLRAGVSPDAVTITGTVGVVVAALWLFPLGYLLAGTLVITLFVVSDLIDGTMARRSGRVSPWGAFLDSSLDRFGDSAVFVGVILYLAGRGEEPVGAVLGLACLVLGSIIPYVRARAEGLGLRGDVGLVERADRLVLVLVTTGLVGLGLPVRVLTVVLGVLAVASLVTVVQRMVHVRRQIVAGEAR